MFGVFVIGLIVGALVQPSYETGKCPEHDGDTPTYYIDPTNCTRYYECNNGIPLRFSCPRHTVFDDNLKVCVHSPDGKCLVHQAPRVGNARLAEDCEFSAGEGTTFILEESNSSIYYTCSDGVRIQHECPYGLEFNAKELRCDYPDRADSHPVMFDGRVGLIRAPPLRIRKHQVRVAVSADGPHLAKKCPREDGDWPTFLVDPVDCSKFFECSHGRPVPMQCPYDLYFSTVSLTCDKQENVNCDRRREDTIH